MSSRPWFSHLPALTDDQKQVIATAAICAAAGAAATKLIELAAEEAKRRLEAWRGKGGES